LAGSTPEPGGMSARARVARNSKTSRPGLWTQSQ
jgi:hypothetical protein